MKSVYVKTYTEAEVSEIIKKSYDRGYEAGFDLGYEEGLSEGHYDVLFTRNICKDDK